MDPSLSSLCLQHLPVMNSKRLWVITIVTVLGLFAAGPHSPGVWAQNITSASCRPGWEWVCSSPKNSPSAPLPQTESVVFECFRGRSRTRGFHRIRIHSDKIHVVLLLLWKRHVVKPVGTMYIRINWTWRGLPSSDCRVILFSFL